MTFKNKNPRADYDSNEFAEYRPKLKEELLKEQKYICAYCCARIAAEDSHNEHIEPRHPQKGVSRRSPDYTNLVASCFGFQGEATCGPKKGNEYDETKFVSPLNPECEEKFSYMPNGKISGDVYTIDLLNLNSYKLRKAREAKYMERLPLDKETIKMCYLDENGEKHEPFVNVVKWYLNNMCK